MQRQSSRTGKQCIQCAASINSARNLRNDEPPDRCYKCLTSVYCRFCDTHISTRNSSRHFKSAGHCQKVLEGMVRSSFWAYSTSAHKFGWFPQRQQVGPIHQLKTTTSHPQIAPRALPTPQYLTHTHTHTHTFSLIQGTVFTHFIAAASANNTNQCS